MVVSDPQSLWPAPSIHLSGRLVGRRDLVRLSGRLAGRRDGRDGRIRIRNRCGRRRQIMLSGRLGGDVTWFASAAGSPVDVTGAMVVSESAIAVVGAVESC